jgi:hypothetical protein
MTRSISFEVVPTGWEPSAVGDTPFVPFVLDVPVLDVKSEEADEYSAVENRAARRAWWSAFHLLGPNGIEPEDFEVFELVENDARGRQVTSGGFILVPEITGDEYGAFDASGVDPNRYLKAAAASLGDLPIGGHDIDREDLANDWDKTYGRRD